MNTSIVQAGGHTHYIGGVVYIHYTCIHYLRSFQERLRTSAAVSSSIPLILVKYYKKQRNTASFFSIHGKYTLFIIAKLRKEMCSQDMNKW